MVSITPSHAGCTVKLLERISELEQANTNLKQENLLLKQNYSEDMAGANHAIARQKHDIDKTKQENYQLKQANAELNYKVDAILAISHNGYPIQDEQVRQVAFTHGCSDDDLPSLGQLGHSSMQPTDVASSIGCAELQPHDVASMSTVCYSGTVD